MGLRNGEEKASRGGVDTSGSGMRRSYAAAGPGGEGELEGEVKAAARAGWEDEHLHRWALWGRERGRVGKRRWAGTGPGGQTGEEIRRKNTACSGHCMLRVGQSFPQKA